VLILGPSEPVAEAVTAAIRGGDVDGLRRLLAEHPELARASIGPRSMLHVATDWPGRFPNDTAVVAVLVEAGADANARFAGSHCETPLHWAASGDNVEVLDALLDAGADIEAPGAVIGGGTPLADAVAFGPWRAARRLVERGAGTSLQEAAALGLLDRVRGRCERPPPPRSEEITEALWYACHGGQRPAAEYVLDRGADLDWVSTWDGLTPLDAARRSGHDELAEWLVGRGARPAADAGGE
jgi:ankyrin repeat protein